MSSSLQLPLFSTSVPGYPSALGGLTIADHLITNDGTELMDWQPDGILAVEAWKYQQITLPALITAGGPFALPPLYTYHPLPINFSAMAAFHHLHQHSDTTSQVLEVELALASWQGQQVAAAIQQDRQFLWSRYQEAVKRERSLGEVVEVLKMQMEHQQDQQQQQQDQQQLIKGRVEDLRQKQADQLAASASLSLSSSSSSPSSSLSSSFSSLSSPSSASTTTAHPPPPPPRVKPGVADQGDAFRGLCAPSIASSAPASSSLASVLPDKFGRQLAGMFNLV